MAVRTFGRKGSDDTGLMRRREAFIVEQRAPVARPALEDVPSAAAPVLPVSAEPTERPNSTRRKSLTTAYVCWLLGGAISAHRFYLGFPVSASAQASLAIGSWLALANGFLAAGFGLLAALLWLLADLFLLTRLCLAPNERA